jgi:hypothetical protein
MAAVISITSNNRSKAFSEALEKFFSFRSHFSTALLMPPRRKRGSPQWVTPLNQLNPQPVRARPLSRRMRSSLVVSGWRQQDDERRLQPGNFLQLNG